MHTFERKRTIRRWLFSWPLALLLLVAVVFAGRATFSMYRAYGTAAVELSRVEVQRQVLEEKRVFLESEIERLGSSRGIEEEIRQRFPVVREGENMVLLIDDATKTPALPAGTGDRGSSWWSRWFRR